MVVSLWVRLWMGLMLFPRVNVPKKWKINFPCLSFDEGVERLRQFSLLPD
jgi:hypothetical protein